MVYLPWTIRWNTACEQKLDEIEAKHGPNAIIGLEWALNNRPEEWLRIPGTTLFMARTKTPLIRAFFKLDNRIVSVLQIDIE